MKFNGFFQKLETSLYPYFREQDGSALSLVPDEPYSLDQELSPNYCPVVEIILSRGSFLILTIKMSVGQV